MSVSKGEYEFSWSGSSEVAEVEVKAKHTLGSRFTGIDVTVTFFSDMDEHVLTLKAARELHELLGHAVQQAAVLEKAAEVQGG